MIEHARAESPGEACGLLAGSGDLVTAVYRLKNARSSPFEYELTADGYLLAADLDDAGQLLGVFHSHPAGEAYPSMTDRRQAFWPVRYVILSLAGKQPNVRCFRMNKSVAGSPDEPANVTEEKVEIV